MFSIKSKLCLQINPTEFDAKWMTARASPACYYKTRSIGNLKIDQIVVVGGEVWDRRRSVISSSACLLSLTANRPSENIRDAFYEEFYSVLKKGPVEMRNHSKPSLQLKP